MKPKSFLWQRQENIASDLLNLAKLTIANVSVCSEARLPHKGTLTKLFRSA